MSGLSSYPLTTPVNKHDLLCVKGASDSSSPSAVVFSSSAELFKRAISYDDKDFARNGKPEQKGFVYSYKDGPEYPGGLFVLCRYFILVGLSPIESFILFSVDPQPFNFVLYIYR